MCKGQDILKVAAVAAAVYTGGTSLGLFGAEAGAALGAAEGAAALGAGEAAVGGMSVVDAATGAVMSSTAAAQAGMAPAYLAEAAVAGGAAGTMAAAGGEGAAAAAAAAPAAAGGTGAATGASTWLQTAKTVAPFVSAAGSALTGIAALSGAGARGMPQAAEMPAAPNAQAGVTPDLYAVLKKKNALLFAGAGPESTDLTKGSASAVNLGKNALLGN